MAQNPKYDNDVVNLGYLNKRLGQTEESINKNNSSISQLPKNYSIPPNPPYYKDSLLCYKNKIYKCNTTKLNGVFSWNDWTIAATDDTTLSDFINNTYELEKLEIQEQIDGKVQTYYQEMDPSNEWITDLEKAKHIGDYWYNTTNNTQWRYNRNTDTIPITYSWAQVNVPNSVFDLIDKKKSIYTIKPTSYKKDDLWIIEDTLSDEDLPTGTEDNPIAKGDWVFSVADSDTYNKEHWIKRDEDISLSYLEQHYYTIGDIDSSFKELERNTDSKITKAKEEISLNVSQTYTTKEEHTKAINDFDKQIGTINDTITTHETNISNLNVGVGKISASVESIKSKTEELSVDIDGVKENIIPTSTVSGPNIHIEDASDKKMVNFEIEGKSKQKTSSQNANLFDEDYYKNATYSTSTYKYTLAKFKGSRRLWFKAKLKDGGTAISGLYICVSASPNPNTSSVYAMAISNGAIVNNSLDFSSYDTLYISYYPTTISVSDIFNNYNFWVSTSDVNKYEPFVPDMPSPDYPSEIESVGYENLWSLNSSYTTETGSEYVLRDTPIPTIPAGTYILSLKKSANVKVLFYFKDSLNNGTEIYLDGVEEQLITFSSDITIAVIYIYGTSPCTISDIQITKGTKKRSYIPYGKYGIEVKTTNGTDTNASLFVLDQPLRSLPNGVKDIAYIKNNILYVDRKVGSVVLDGSEDWVLQETMSNGKVVFRQKTLFLDSAGSSSRGLCNYLPFDNTVYSASNNKIGFYFNEYKFMNFVILSTTASTITKLKDWLSTNNTQVDYELAEPYTEKIGEVEIPSTFKGVNSITTTDELEPVMNIEYVRDTILSDYVEGQVGNAVAIQERKNAEFQITNEEIKSSVSNISTDLDGTKSSLNSVEEKITSQEKTINIISKNIDGTTGDIREVTTTTGFTFNSEGMTIDDGAGYKARHTAQGTFYKDGDTTTGQYTKDGSKQKDLELFGTYSYGKNDINDTPMFVAQLYTDEKGEECFGHFYNGGDY